MPLLPEMAGDRGIDGAIPNEGSGGVARDSRLATKT